jgi:iron complex transport system ATP-binding protein
MSDALGLAEPSWTLECRGLSVQRGGRTVLHDVNLTLRAGECLALIGPNGSGKTTLMLALLGLLRPQGGVVRLDGRSVHTLPARSRARFAAYVPQVVEHFPALTIRDVVAGGRYPHASPLRPLSLSDQGIVQNALERCRLVELAERPINAVSGGERQKALLAAAIAQDAQVMFLDEPDAVLDPAVQAELVALLRTWRTAGRAMVVISHELNLPLALGGCVVALRQGRIADEGATGDVLRPTRLAAIYGARFEEALLPDGRRVPLPAWAAPAASCHGRAAPPGAAD